MKKKKFRFTFLALCFISGFFKLYLRPESKIDCINIAYGHVYIIKSTIYHCI